MKTPLQVPVWHTYPGMIALITARHGGKQNVMASGWHTYIGSSPAFYGISLRKETYTYGLIEQSGEFGVHFLPAHCSEAIQAVGSCSGEEVDKFSAFKIAYEQAKHIDVPLPGNAAFIVTWERLMYKMNRVYFVFLLYLISRALISALVHFLAKNNLQIHFLSGFEGYFFTYYEIISPGSPFWCVWC